MDLTVAICTYRRLESLRTMLQSLLACRHPSLQWEILVVDNAGDPAVAQLAAEVAAEASAANPPIPMRYEHEPQLGIGHARNCAVRNVAAPIVLFVDDDVTLHPDWLVRMAAAIQEQSHCDFWGGRIEAVWQTPIPKWFDMTRCPMLGDLIVRYQQGDHARPWDPRKDPAFYTANLALRVETIKKAGDFDARFGHRGTFRFGGEDSMMVHAIADAGGSGWYVADAVVYHPVPPERSKPYVRRFAWRQGSVSVAMAQRERTGYTSKQAEAGHPTPASWRSTPRWMYRAAIERFLTGMGRWAVGTVRGNEAAAFAGQCTALFNLSKLWHALSGRRY